jgi:hypothetical protein
MRMEEDDTESRPGPGTGDDVGDERQDDQMYMENGNDSVKGSEGTLVDGERDEPEDQTQDEGADHGFSDEEQFAMDPDDFVHYEYSFPGGGGSRYNGIPPYPGTTTEADRRTMMHDEELGQWLPIPPGYSAPRRAPQDAEEAEAAVWGHPPIHGEDDSRSSSPTGSNFSEDRRAKEQAREKKKKQGRDVSDTENEDDEDDRALADSVVPESSARVSRRVTVTIRGSITPEPSQPREPRGTHLPAQPSTQRANISRARKGKGRAMEGPDEMMAVDEETAGDVQQDVDMDDEGMDIYGKDEESEEDADETRVMGRRYTKEEEKEIGVFGMEVKERAEQLAAKYGRKSGNVLIMAGLGMKLARKENISNVYKSWYAMKHDKDSDCKSYFLSRVIG